jgi:hypothetical protein
MMGLGFLFACGCRRPTPVPHLSILGSLLLITAGLVIAAVVGSFGIETRNRRFQEISP